MPRVGQDMAGPSSTAACLVLSGGTSVQLCFAVHLHIRVAPPTSNGCGTGYSEGRPA